MLARSRMGAIRQGRGMTVLEVATAIGISQHRLRHIEQGVSKPTAEERQELAALYSVTCLDLITGGPWRKQE